MKSFKSLVLSAVAAATTLGFVAVSAPAQACPFCNGTKLNTPFLNGIQLQGMRVNGVRLNGAEATGAKAGQPVAVTLPR